MPLTFATAACCAKSAPHGLPSRSRPGSLRVLKNDRGAFRWSWSARERRQAKGGAPASRCRPESSQCYRDTREEAPSRFRQESRPECSTRCFAFYWDGKARSESGRGPQSEYWRTEVPLRCPLPSISED